MEVGVLGSIEVHVGGSPIPLGGPRRRSLLGLLALHANRPRPVVRLVADLWEGQPPSAAEATLHSHISQLRKTLGPGRLVTRPAGYELVLGPDELDAACFEREAARGHAELRAGQAASATHWLSTALTRWRGPALAQASGADWARPEIVRLEELRIAASEDLLDGQLALGAYAEMVAGAEAAVASHPLRERLWGLLMLGLYRSGRQVDALRAYERLRKHLAEELGVEPNDELSRLEGAILRHDPSMAGPPGSVVRAQSGGHSPAGAVTSFIGRETELGLLDATLTRR